jgi:dTDP-4-amino-4,6-dideoxygalactose transaminase
MTPSNLPAILGGTPTRTRPYPPPNFIGAEEKRLVMQVLDSGVLSAYVAHHGPFFEGGAMVHALEDELRKRFGVEHAVSVNSATSGLHAAIAAALCGPGDEVIVSPYTMSASASMITVTGATPVFADIRPDTFCLDLDDVRRKLSARTRAIVVVNIFGGTAELHEMRKLCDERGIVLIEDNAQAPGAVHRGALAGTIGHMGVLSFNCHKTIQCGEGGAVLTNDAVLADRLRLMRNHGEVVLAQRPTVPDELRGLVGFNYRLTELGSAVALAQIRRLDELTLPRIEMAQRVTEGLRGIDGITPPFVADGDTHVYYVYPFKVDAAKLGLTRDELHRALAAEGIACAPGYVLPIYLQPMFDDRVAKQKAGFGAGVWHPRPESGVRYARGICPVAERMHFVELMTTNIIRADFGEAEAKEMVQAVRKIVEHGAQIRAKLR